MKWLIVDVPTLKSLKSAGNSFLYSFSELRKYIDTVCCWFDLDIPDLQDLYLSDSFDRDQITEISSIHALFMSCIDNSSPLVDIVE